MPEAMHRDAHVLHLLAIGESPVAGVGVEAQSQAITAQYASRLAVLTHQPVHWRAWGKNGATAADALRDIVPQLKPSSGQCTDIVLIAFGVNDTTAFRSSGNYRRDLSLLVTALRALLNPRLFVITGVPPLHLFPALPQPLRLVLGLKARALSREARQVTISQPHAVYVPFDGKTYTPELMAVDGYHPSAAGVIVWAGDLAGRTAAALAREDMTI